MWLSLTATISATSFLWMIATSTASNGADATSISAGSLGAYLPKYQSPAQGTGMSFFTLAAGERTSGIALVS